LTGFYIVFVYTNREELENCHPIGGGGGENNLWVETFQEERPLDSQICMLRYRSYLCLYYGKQGRIERRYSSTYFQIEIRRIKIIGCELCPLYLGITVRKRTATWSRRCGRGGEEKNM